MATPTYAGPLTDVEVPTRHPGTRYGGAKSTGSLNADTTISTTHTLVFAVHVVSVTGALELENGAGGTVIWSFSAAGFYTFQEPLEFPAGLHADVNTASVFFIQYKD